MRTMKRTYRQFRDDNLADTAAALTYYAVLSIFSALMALVVVVGLAADPHTITSELTSLVRSIGPPSAAAALKGPIASLAHRHSTAGFLLAVNFGSALWTASGYVGAFMRSSNTIYQVEEGRSSVTLRPLQTLVTLTMVALVTLVLVGLALTGPIAHKVGAVLGVSSATVTIWDIAKWPVMIVVVAAVIAELYYLGPNAKLGGLKSILPGSLFAVVVWLVASIGFAIYVTYFNSYNNVYGALGVIVGVLVALWVINVAILLGAEINAGRQRTHLLASKAAEGEGEVHLEERVTPAPR
jgi:membrane protein